MDWKGGPVTWPARSPYFTGLDFFAVGNWQRVCLPATAVKMKIIIQNAFISVRVELILIFFLEMD